jgi:glucose uptake protein GlcU
MSSLKAWQKVALVLGGYALIMIVLGLVFGSDGKNDEFQRQNEF